MEGGVEEVGRGVEDCGCVGGEDSWQHHEREYIFTWYKLHITTSHSDTFLTSLRFWELTRWFLLSIRSVERRAWCDMRETERGRIKFHP